MTSKKPIDLLAGFRDFNKDTGKKAKVGIQIKADEVFFNPDDKPVAKEVAAAIVQQIQSTLRLGQAPTGVPLPPLKPSTIEWRKREIEQGKRGGEADPRYKDAAFRAKAKANYEKSYVAPRLGRFQPLHISPRGVLSGMLVESFVARPNKSGQGFSVYVAAKRGTPRPGETLSALESVYGNATLWDQRAQEAPLVQQALQKAADSLVAKNKAAFAELAGQLTDAAQAVLDVAEEGSDVE